MSRIKNRLSALLGALALIGGVLGAGLVPSGTAQAATAGCSGAAAGDCNSQVNGFGYALTVAGRIGTNVYVTAVLDSTVTGRADFIADQTTGNADERTFELAPNGVKSGWCIAQLTGWKRLVIRHCANSRWQQWTGVNTRNTTGTQWINVNSHQTVQGEGAGNAFEAVTTVTNVKGSFFGWGAPGVEPVI